MCLRNPRLYYTCSVISFLIGIYWLLIREDTAGFFFITLTFAFLTIGIQFRSQEQLIEQIDKNKRQIILNQNEIFERLIDRFGDIRINLLWSLPGRGFILFEYTIWRCRTIIDRAWKLVKYSKICKENQKRLFNEMINLVFKSGYNWDNFKLEKTKFIPSDKDLKNFLIMCKKFKDFNLDKGDKVQLEGMFKLFKDVKKQFYGKEK